MHDFYYCLYLGRLFIHLNIIIQVSQHSSIFFYLSNTVLTSAFNEILILYHFVKVDKDIMFKRTTTFMYANNRGRVSNYQPTSSITHHTKPPTPKKVSPP